MRHLIEPCDVDKYARPCDMDDEIIARAIEEAELLDIKPKLGDELFMRLLTHVQFAVLLNGGGTPTNAGTSGISSVCGGRWHTTFGRASSKRV